MGVLGVILGPNGVELDVRDQRHLGVAIAHPRSAHHRAAYVRQFERCAVAAERPGVALVRRIPFEIGVAVDEHERIEPLLAAEQERERRDAGVDQLRREQVGATRPFRVRHRQPLGDELDVERCEIELEVARHLHVAFREAADISLERRFEEAALGDEQDEPGEHDEADDCRQDARDDAKRHARRVVATVPGGRGRARWSRRTICHRPLNRARCGSVPQRGTGCQRRRVSV